MNKTQSVAFYIIDSYGTRIYAGDNMTAARIRLGRMEVRNPHAGYRIALTPSNAAC